MSRARAVAFTLALALAPQARANPIDAFGYGARGAAMGSAMTAVAEDGSANYYNPAGLVRGRDLRIDLGYRYVHPMLKLNGHDLGVDVTSGLNIAIVTPGSIGPFRFAFGVGIFLPDRRITRIRSLPFEQPRFVYYDNRPQRFLMSANVAIQIVPGLYIGGGLTFLSRSVGEVSLQGSVAVSDPDASSLVTKMDVDLLPVRYPQVGLRWDATRRLSFGVTYRHSFLLESDLKFRIDGSIGNPGLPPVVEKAFLAASTFTGDLFQPWQLTAGAAYRFARNVMVAFDLTFARWSEFPGAAALVDIELDIGPQFNNQVMLPPNRSYPAPGFRDILIPRLGVEWRAKEGDRVALDTRFGYIYEPSPVPDQIGEETFADCDKHTFSLGAGVEVRNLGPVLPKPLAIDLYFAATALPSRHTRKLDPVDKVGDFRADGALIGVGLDLRTRF